MSKQGALCGHLNMHDKYYIMAATASKSFSHFNMFFPQQKMRLKTSYALIFIQV